MKKYLCLLLLFFNLVFIGCTKEKEPVPGIWIKFIGIQDDDLAFAKIFETARGDTSIHLDTIEYGQLNHVNDYTITLDFKTNIENGDYLILADSIKQINVISDVEIIFRNYSYEFTYKFNGSIKNSQNREDVFLTITR